MTFGERLAEWIDRRGVTQKWLADSVGITETSVSRYVNDERIPKFDVVRDIANALGVRTDELLADYPQDREANEYRYLSPGWLDAIAAGLTAGAVKHPGETWRQIPADEHLSRALRHINLYRKGDRSEPHIINASMRLMMAFETAGEDR